MYTSLSKEDQRNDGHMRNSKNLTKEIGWWISANFICTMLKPLRKVLDRDSSYDVCKKTCILAYVFSWI